MIRDFVVILFPGMKFQRGVCEQSGMATQDQATPKWRLRALRLKLVASLVFFAQSAPIKELLLLQRGFLLPRYPHCRLWGVKDTPRFSRAMTLTGVWNVSPRSYLVDAFAVTSDLKEKEAVHES